jgi:hypothetical protein
MIAPLSPSEILVPAAKDAAQSPAAWNDALANQLLMKMSEAHPLFSDLGQWMLRVLLAEYRFSISECSKTENSQCL